MAALPFFYKDWIGIRSHSKVDMSQRKDIKLIYVYAIIWFKVAEQT